MMYFYNPFTDLGKGKIIRNLVKLSLS